MLKRLYRAGIVRRCMAFLLCVVVSVTSPLSSAAAGVTSGSSASVNGGEEDGSWIIKTKKYMNWVDPEGEPNLYSSGTTTRFQVNDNAFVIRKNGRYYVRLDFPGYSAYDMIQVVNPEKNKEFLQYFIANAEKPSDMLLPFGTFNAPASAEECKYPDNYETVIKARLDENVNQYYLQDEDISITRRDEAMDWGVMEFELSSLSDYVIINPGFSARSALPAIIIGFDEEKKTEVPESLTYDAGEYTMGFEWADYTKGVVTWGNRSDTPAVLTLMNSIFNPAVKVTINEEGKLSGIFTVNQKVFGTEKGDDQITSIGLAKSRDMDFFSEANQTSKVWSALHIEVNGTSFEEFELSDDSTVTIPFEDMMDGKLIRFSTVETDTFNSKKKIGNQYKYYWGKLYPTKEIGNVEDVTVTADNGVVLKTDTLTFKDGYQFISETTQAATETIDQATLDGIMAYAASDDSYSIWSYRIEDEEGNRVEPESSLTVDIPVPEEYNIDTTLFLHKTSVLGGSSAYGLPNGVGELIQNDEGKWVVRLTPKSYKYYDYSLVIFDSGTIMTSEELLTLEKGKYYEVKPALRNLAFDDRPSMAAAIVSERKGIFHVTDEGEYELYITLRGVEVGDYGYLSNMYVKPVNKSKTRAEVLSYKSTADLRDVEWEKLLESDSDRIRSEEDLNIDFISDTYKLHYPHMVKIPLGEMNNKNEWVLSFVVPAMNLITDTSNVTTGEKEAGLRFIGGAVEIGEEECPEYKNSLLLGLIEEAGWYGDTMSEGDEKTALTSEILKAQEDYEVLKDSPDTEKLLEAVTRLKAALTAAGGSDEEVRLLSDGSYNIPFNLYKVNNSNEISEEVSPYTANFESAALGVKGDSMTVKLTAKEADGTTITSLQYSGDSGALKTAEPFYSDSGELKGYTFTRVYEEEPFRLQLTTSALSYSVRVFLDMDFENAEKITASDEETAQLNALIEELEAVLAKEDSVTLYTASSLAAMQTAVDNAQLVISISDSLESDTVQTQISSLTKAKKNLKLKSEIQELLKQSLVEAEELLLETEKYTEDTLKALSEAVKAAEEINSSYDGSDTMIVKAETAIDSLESAMEGLSLLSREELKQLLEDLAAFEQDDYTQDSWEELIQVMADAEDIAQDAQATDEELKAAIENLENARAGLVYKIYQTLGELIEESRELEEEDYAQSGWKTFSDALETAETIYKDETSDKEALEAAYDDLKDAIEGLEEASESEAMKELRELVTQLEEDYDSDDYEDSSREAFEASLEAAKEILDTERGYKVTDSQIKAQIKALQAEFDALLLEKDLFDALRAQGNSTNGLLRASISPKEVNVLMETATPSEAVKSVKIETSAYSSLDMEEGIYSIDYILWQFAADKVSMGNPALVDAYDDIDGKQAKLEIKDGKVWLYLGLQKMSFNNQTGHLLDMFIMDDLKMDSSGEVIKSYTKLKPTILEYTDETDDYGPPEGEKYPKLLKFNITEFAQEFEDYIPVMVNVPVMGSSAEQPAYILLSYDSLNLLEGDEEEEEPEEEELDFTDFTQAVNTAIKKDENDYTQTSYDALEKSVEAADTLKGYTDEYTITQDMVDARTKAVNATVAALILKEEADDSETDDSNKKALNTLLLKVAGYQKSDYTSETYNNLMTAYENGLEVYEDEDATMLQITRAISSLEKAISNLIKASQVKKTRLLAVISTVKGLSESNFTVASWTVLTMYLDLAKEIYNDSDASQDEVDGAQKDLQEAIENLVEKSSEDSDTDEDDGSTSGSDEDDGYYKVSVRLWHSSMNKASMGDSAISKTAYIHMEDGNATMRLVTKKMTVSGITAHLHDFWIYNDGDYDSAELISTESSKWIYEFELPDADSTYYKCKVDPQVDVMGDDPVKARLKVTWSSLDEIDEDDWDDLEGDTDDDDDSTSSSGSSSKSTELKSEETGIKVKGSTGGPGIVLEASKKDSGTEYDRATNALGSVASQFVLYDIKLRSGSGYVQPGSAVTLSIPIPSGYDTENLILFRINDDGSREEISGIVNGSYFEASVDHFSLYALAESNQPKAVLAFSEMSESVFQEEGKTAGITTSGNKKNSKSTSIRTTSLADKNAGEGVGERGIPYTGDGTPVKGLMGISLFSLLVCLGTILPRKRREEIS